MDISKLKKELIESRDDEELLLIEDEEKLNSLDKFLLSGGLRRVFEDEEAINRVLPDLIAQKRAGNRAPTGANKVMDDNAMKVSGNGDNVVVKTPSNWKGTPILRDILSQQSDVAHKIGSKVKDDRVPGGTGTTPQLDLGDKIKHAVSPEVLEEIKQASVQNTTPAAPSSGRANANFNFGELAIGAILSNPDARTIEDIKNHKIPLENVHDNEKYLEHLMKQDPRKVMEFIQNFREKTREFGFAPNPEDIWIRSTNQQMGPQSIIDAFKGRDDAATADSADVLFKDRGGQMRGISSKATADAYAGSGGLEKLFNRISKNRNLLDENGEEFELGSRLIDVRNLMFRAAGLPTNTAESNAMWGRDGYKEHRSEYNDLMRNPNNPFFGRLDELFKEYNPDIIKNFLNHIYPDNLPYELWKFDNDNFKAMDRDLINDDDYSLNAIQNPKQGEGEDRAAKRWFSLDNKDGPEFAIENRIKSQKPWGSVQYNLVPWDDKKVLRKR